MSFISSYSQGKKAFKDGLKLEDNPYQHPVTNPIEEITRQENFEWWNTGFNDCRCAALVSNIYSESKYEKRIN